MIGFKCWTHESDELLINNINGIVYNVHLYNGGIIQRDELVSYKDKGEIIPRDCVFSYLV